ncbi:hypothetical protein ACFVH6_43615 [Spirillospora sp. NPDC127200]
MHCTVTNADNATARAAQAVDDLSSALRYARTSTLIAEHLK